MPSKTFTLDDFKAFHNPPYAAVEPAPNATPLPIGTAISTITLSSTGVQGTGWGKLPDGSSGFYRLFTFHGQGGGMTGEGLILASEAGALPARAWKFALCKHEFVGTGSREQSQRGWHPGHCSKCGLDMSVDSGD